ncbi:MAG: DEAD/DEAH box helicase family protein [Sulfuricurvum sp.]|uniref:DEAD/DEAH box helicase n=1 Tax=Sulfuricurvum sp. TaxID=2025608 RepID=UPI0025F8F435|nr:type ISP restriction/modification enzyme [Sulfuricurvum sp.]MCK9372427.1 DEAD/DEAH box helicase family protein [Sulfuricurvum sp.]
MVDFDNVLEKYRKYSFSERDKGDRFERLMQAYLHTDPKYAYLFKNVWLWNEFPQKGDFGGKDTGIDLVALTHEGDYWAIQCKCYQASATIDKKSVDSFLSTSSREFIGENLQTIGFTQRLWISTTNKWGLNALEAIQNQKPPLTRLNLLELQEAPVDWEKLENGISGELARTAKKELREHQIEALTKTNIHFQVESRGKLIMACGTGKTFTSLRIAENETNGNGLILFLVPSIALLGQTLREWSADAKEPIKPICICSDSRITKKSSKNEDSESMSVVDLAMPASTDINNIIRQFRYIRNNKNDGMAVVFSTYQSIEVIAEAQKRLLAEDPTYGTFDLIICDEAHRTTGAALTEEDSSSFIKVHDNNFIKASKRLYMTATPRLYSDDSKSKAAQNDAIICSMDDEKTYGDEIYRIGFGEAVERDLLTDYKVLILTLSDKDISPTMQAMVANEDHEINADDASKLIGCINALSKQVLGDEGLIKSSDPEPMKRAVAFCQNIKISKHITTSFNEVTDIYGEDLNPSKREQMVSVSSKHIDGAMSAPERDELLGWLKSNSMESGECRVLTNVRCLSEGVDVPSLDAVMFLSARNSQVDVVQSVGRVMRKSPGKKYGYIIIPVVVPSDMEASKALDDNDRFKVVWTVLNALRAHDDRFNATVNKIELNKKKPDQIIIGTGSLGGDDEEYSSKEEQEAATKKFHEQLTIQFEELQNAVFAKMVLKVGDRVYWEKWAKDVAVIAQRQIERITHLITDDEKHRAEFEHFLDGLRRNINPAISQTQAIEMLSQHVITKPVFEALFEGYSFVSNNPVSKSMQNMLDLLESQSLDKDSETLQRFYDSVRKRASGIDNAEGKQRIIIELYDKFFKTAFPKMVEQLGIVYTPVEVVDFIIHSVNDVLKQEFGRTLSDENIHILDPFTGTGTFMTRLLQSGLIEKKDLERKYRNELHANEIVLLAYYIAAVNIENAFHDQLGEDSSYEAFEGIVLTDTFQMSEVDEASGLSSDMFPQNSERAMKQKKAPLRVIIGNPPYSVGQKSANDNAQNQKYEKLDSRIAETYAALTSATNKNSLYDSYLKAFRWGTDRLDENGGVLAFVSNGAWIDGNSTEGFRKSIENEFSSVWVFNLRGNARSSGTLRQKEAGNVFGGGSRTPITITILIKNPNNKKEKATIHYHDIGDYLTREDKLKIISDFSSISNKKMKWNELTPNEHGDWLNHRNDIFSTFVPLAPDKKFDTKTQTFFVLNSMGVGSSRDAWVYNSSKKFLIQNMQKTIIFFNNQIDTFQEEKKKKPETKLNDFIDKDPTKISWSSSLIPKVESGDKATFEEDKIFKASYRPFFKQFLYFGDKMIHRRGQFSEIFRGKSLVINISSTDKGFGLLITDGISDIHFNGDTQSFPLYYYEEKDKKQKSLFDGTAEDEFIKRDGISNFIYEQAKKLYGNNVSREDIFYYVYGILHSKDYQISFENDLSKMLPRLPLLDEPREFWKFSKAGRELAELHINYETVPAYPDVTIQGEESQFFKVEKMRFPKKDQKDTINFNSKIIITNIPEKAYEYQVNGKSAIEWVMERYQLSTHKESGIRNDPNDWAEEVGNPRYILDLLLSVINLSVQTVDIVNNLPKIEFK